MDMIHIVTLSIYISSQMCVKNPPSFSIPSAHYDLLAKAGAPVLRGFGLDSCGPGTLADLVPLCHACMSECEPCAAQSGEQVLRLDELQDIDELFVVEVRSLCPTPLKPRSINSKP